MDSFLLTRFSFLFISADNSSAITEHRKVRLHYLKYSLEKKLILRRKDSYLLSPFALVWANSNYYLVCNYDPYDDISHFRIDKMRDIEILTEQAKPAPENFDVYSYTNSRIFMFGGDARPVTLRFIFSMRTLEMKSITVSHGISSV